MEEASRAGGAGVPPETTTAVGDDWIEGFIRFTEGLPSPVIFREWAAIATVAASLERRVWAEPTQKRLYPNLFVLLVGPPGSGKSIAIDETRDLLREIKGYHLAPSSVTSASLVDSVADAEHTAVTPEGLQEYRSLIVQASEFGVLVPSHDLEFMATLNDIYDNPRVFSQRRRHQNQGKTKEILNPQLNILAGAQPGFLSTLLPEEAWSMGFTSRLIMVYANSAPQVELFGDFVPRLGEASRLRAGLTAMSRMQGRMMWQVEAAECMSDWVRQRMPPVPESPRLQHYSSRRVLYACKLSMVASVSRSCASEPIIRCADVHRARHWLLHAEALMPDIFRDMVGKSDTQVLQELHFYLWRLWLRDKKPIHEARLLAFLATKAPSEKVFRLLELAERSNLVSRDAGSKLYTPRARGPGTEDI